MFVTIINDCLDPNAMGRQATRVSAFLNCPVNTWGVVDDTEAAGCLIDALDASQGRSGWILLNVAPRNEETAAINGSPFAYFQLEETQVMASTGGLSLALLGKFGINNLLQLNIPETLEACELPHAIANSQFRSFDLLPRLVGHLNYMTPPPEWFTVYHKCLIFPTGIVWYVDCFGNVKLTTTNQEAQGQPKIVTKVGDLPFYQRLTDVPEGELAVVVGSSGFREIRFLELVVRGGSAAECLGLKVGDQVA